MYAPHTESPLFLTEEELISQKQSLITRISVLYFFLCRNMSYPADTLTGAQTESKIQYAFWIMAALQVSKYYLNSTSN